MATATFDAYKLLYNSTYTGYLVDALIYCYQGTTFAGQIQFHKAEASDDALECTIEGGKPYVRYRIDRFRDVHHILLHEKPLYLYVDDLKGVGFVGTAEKEPTGEEEP